METIYKEEIGVVHKKNHEWRNQLALYKEELKIFNERLNDLSLKNRDKETLVSIEQFQNKFIIQRDKIDELEHDINVVEDNAVYSGQIHIRRISYKRTAKFIYIEKA